DLFSFYLRYAIDRGWDKTAIFDLIPVLWLLKPEIFKYKEGKVDIVLEGEDTQGQTILKEGPGNHIVLYDADREACMQIFFEAIDLLDERYQ
ncbi:MAG: nucleoside hydrolase, partial [Erysipelotrichaceae bacterium]|nr:nucleoside hydrolase [Erysipelotrichaceae bacterium]